MVFQEHTLMICVSIV